MGANGLELPLQAGNAQGRRNARFDREGTTSMATSRLESHTHVGFGRGSAVREYWLTRCQGFSAVRANGGRLGRVKRVETNIEGTFLRLSGFRARRVPLSAVDSVLPAASLLVVSTEPLDEGAEDGLPPAGASRPSWVDDTVPWWELVDAKMAGAGARGHLNSASRRVRPGKARFALQSRRIQTLALCIKRAEPFAKAFAAKATILVERARNLARTFARNAIRANRATRRALNNRWLTAQSAVLAAIRRIRGGTGRLLFRIAAWVGGSNSLAVSDRPDSQPVIDEPDTEEIDLGSGAT